MVAIPNRLSKTPSLASNATSASAARKRQSRQSLRFSAAIHARCGHDKLELIDTKAHIGNNSGRVLDQVASSFSSSISGPGGGGASISSSIARRELWQERTPTSHDFPHIKPYPTKRRHAAPRAGIRARSARLRRGLSLTLYSYWPSGKIPFLTPRHWRLRLDKARLRTSTIPKPETPRKRSMATIQISEPFSPAKAASRADLSPPVRKTSLPFKSANPSPLGCHPPTTLSEPIEKPRTAPSTPKPSTSLRTATPPLPKLHPNRHRKRDSFNRAKIHIRRPPKGIVHWFDAVDDVSDEEYPDAADATSQKSPRTTSQASAFQPSLGPHRSRAAPISKLVPVEGHPDYFTFREASLRRQVAARSRSPTAARRRRNRESQLAEANPWRFVAERRLTDQAGDMSSDDEDQTGSRPFSAKYWDMSTPSPGAMGQVYLRRAASHRKASINTHTARQSMSSAQSGITSASLPFMLRVMPTFEGAPPLPDSPPVTTPDYLPISYFALTGRLPGSSSGAASPISDSRLSAVPSSEGIGASLRKGSILSSPPASAASRLMAVTEEEMALLEAMRRKRGQMQAQQKSARFSALASSANMVPQLMPMPLRPVKKKEAISRPTTAGSQERTGGNGRKASASSTITLEDGENIEFPTPPISDSRPGSKGQSDEPAASKDYQQPSETNADDTYHVPRQGSYWSPEIPTPGTDHEADPFDGSEKADSRPGTARSARLRALFATRPTEPPRPSNHSHSAKKAPFSVEFGDLHLLPLSHPGCLETALCPNGPKTPDAEAASIAPSHHSAESVSSPGLTDGDTSSCGRTSRNEAQTPSKTCTFTPTAFEIVDSSDEEPGRMSASPYASMHRRTETPLLGKVGDMYAFADESGEIPVLMSEGFGGQRRSEGPEHGLGVRRDDDDQGRTSSRIDIGVLNAFHALSGGLTSMR